MAVSRAVRMYASFFHWRLPVSIRLFQIYVFELHYFAGVIFEHCFWNKEVERDDLLVNLVSCLIVNKPD